MTPLSFFWHGCTRVRQLVRDASRGCRGVPGYANWHVPPPKLFWILRLRYWGQDAEGKTPKAKGETPRARRQGWDAEGKTPRARRRGWDAEGETLRTRCWKWDAQTVTLKADAEGKVKGKTLRLGWGGKIPTEKKKTSTKIEHGTTEKFFAKFESVPWTSSQPYHFTCPSLRMEVSPNFFYLYTTKYKKVQPDYDSGTKNTYLATIGFCWIRIAI